VVVMSSGLSPQLPSLANRVFHRMGDGLAIYARCTPADLHSPLMCTNRSLFFSLTGRIRLCTSVAMHVVASDPQTHDLEGHSLDQSRKVGCPSTAHFVHADANQDNFLQGLSWRRP